MAPTPRFVVSNADLDKDWDELFATYWDSWKQPLQAVGQLTFVGIGEGGKLEAESFAQNKEEYLSAARTNPSQIWRKVEDVTRKQQGLPAIVGGGAFTQCTEPPFPSQDQQQGSEINLPGPHYPRGSERHGLVQELYSQMWSCRAKWMHKPHSYGNALWILPEYRQHGVARLLLDTWLSDIDHLGLEGFLEASSMSAPLYQQHGFRVLQRLDMVFHRSNPTQDWLNLVQDMQAHPITIMWRPRGGLLEQGGHALPLEGDTVKAKL